MGVFPQIAPEAAMQAVTTTPRMIALVNQLEPEMFSYVDWQLNIETQIMKDFEKQLAIAGAIVDAFDNAVQQICTPSGFLLRRWPTTQVATRSFPIVLIT
ncbi:hypothetical protein EUX98_g9711, partial [Antrodiella citrinella]